jgi:endonuclease/exonuclease/phosphatase family metal-dependent hydrolase
VRLASFNLLHGRSLQDGAVDVARLRAEVRSLGADVLAIQEVDFGQPRSAGIDMTAEIAAELDVPPGQHRFVPTLVGVPGSDWTAARSDWATDEPAYGIGLLSRLPVESWHVLRLPAAPTRAPVLVPGQRRRVLWIRDEPRVALCAVLRTELPRLPRLTVVATHLSFVPGWNVLQLRRLVRRLRPLPGPLMLLADLNLPGRVPELVSGWRSLGRAATYPAAAPRVQIDHALGRGLAVDEWQVSATELGISDHRALVVQSLPASKVASVEADGSSGRSTRPSST